MRICLIKILRKQPFDNNSGNVFSNNFFFLEHMCRTTAEHAAAGEELVGSLGVVCEPVPKKKTTKVFLLYNGLEPELREKKKREHYNSDLFSYISSEEINDRIVACIKRSFQVSWMVANWNVRF